ncbi:MAG TPA: hypothetical protein VE082_03500, partial [Desulfobaccales bacterium]|nr:hypothetical protein [Desulfobaccales bacterium]
FAIPLYDLPNRRLRRTRAPLATPELSKDMARLTWPGPVKMAWSSGGQMTKSQGSLLQSEFIQKCGKTEFPGNTDLSMKDLTSVQATRSRGEIPLQVT